jgi:hypothetical protein
LLEGFKDKYANTYVWLDVENPDEIPPTFEGSVVIKVTMK